MNDPIVDEVRQARMMQTRKCNDDLATIAKGMKEIQRSCGHRIVRLTPRLRQPTSSISRTA